MNMNFKRKLPIPKEIKDAHHNLLRIGQNTLVLDTEKSTRLESWPGH